MAARSGLAMAAVGGKVKLLAKGERWQRADLGAVGNPRGKVRREERESVGGVGIFFFDWAREDKRGQSAPPISQVQGKDGGSFCFCSFLTA